MSKRRQQVIAKVRKNSCEEYRISRDEFHGQRGVQIRLWRRTGTAYPFFATPQRISLPPAMVAEIVGALMIAAALDGEGLEDQGKCA